MPVAKVSSTDMDVLYVFVADGTIKTHILLEDMDVVQYLRLLIMDLIGTLLVATLVPLLISHVLQDMLTHKLQAIQMRVIMVATAAAQQL